MRKRRHGGWEVLCREVVVESCRAAHELVLDDVVFKRW